MTELAGHNPNLQFKATGFGVIAPFPNCLRRAVGNRGWFIAMNNRCHFSPCRQFRYTLEHVIDPLLPQRRIMWIGLNPSTADENQLDPTLRRIRGFSHAWGFTSFVMTNLFAFRATLPTDMKNAADPVGPENDRWLKAMARQCELIVAAWGVHGTHRDRARAVETLLGRTRLQCVARTKSGAPKHPLYVAKSAPLLALGCVT